MRRRLLTAVGVCTAVAAWAMAEPPATPAPSTPTPEALVAQLGAPRYQDREDAARALEAAGPSALPALRAAAVGANPEIARRAGDLVGRLQRQVDTTKRVAAKTVKLNYRDQPLGNAVNDLKTRTGLNVVLDTAKVADPFRKITCETGDLTAWEAVDAFCAAAGLREAFLAELEVPKPEKPNGGGRRSYYTPPPPPPAQDAVPVTLVDGKAAPLPGTRTTAVRILALPASFPGNRVRLGTGETTIVFDVAPAPGLNWQEVTSIRITKLVDSDGRLGAGGTPWDEAPAFNPYSDFGGMVAWGGPGQVVMRWDFEGNPILPASYPNPRAVTMPIKLATPTAKSLKLLEGVVICEVMDLNQPLVTIDDPAKAVGSTVEAPGGAKLSIVTLQPKDGGGTLFSVRSESPSPWALQRMRNPWGAMWPERTTRMTGNQVKVTDAAGKQLHPGSTSGSDDGITMTMTMDFNLPAGVVPAKVQLVGPKPVVVEVPFKMENVPLP